MDETAEGDEGLDDWSDTDWFCDPADDFAQVGPDDSVYMDIGPFEAVF